MARVCLICPHHVSSQPRSLREADTLAAGGHDVRVVTRWVDAERAEADARLAADRAWRLDAIDLRREAARGRWAATAAVGEAAARLHGLGFRGAALAERGAVRGLGALVRSAAAEPVDLYRAHTQLALPVAARAAAARPAPIDFDCEDLLADAGTDRADLIRAIERRRLPACGRVTVASRAMGDALVERYGIDSPTVLYNVFPLALREGMTPPAARDREGPLRLHWFGQTIGPGRGLEEAVDAAGALGDGVELHLRGRVSDAYRSSLEARAAEAGARGRIVFLPVVDHDALIGTFGSFDVGLALERPDHRNYALTVTNKVFSYLLAGLPVVATDTPGQREALDGRNVVAALYPAGDAGALAAAVRPWADDPAALARASRDAWDLAAERFCWDVERTAFLEGIDVLLEGAA